MRNKHCIRSILSPAHYLPGYDGRRKNRRTVLAPAKPSEDVYVAMQVVSSCLEDLRKRGWSSTDFWFAFSLTFRRTQEVEPVTHQRVRERSWKLPWQLVKMSSGPVVVDEEDGRENPKKYREEHFEGVRFGDWLTIRMVRVSYRSTWRKSLSFEHPVLNSYIFFGRYIWDSTGLHFGST